MMAIWRPNKNQHWQHRLRRKPPPQPTMTTPSTGTAVSQSMASPKQLKDNSCSLEFFHGIIRPQCLTDELFRDEIASASLKEQLVAIGKSSAADGLVKHHASFCDQPVEHAGKDTTKMESCPLSHKKCNIPMSVPAMREVATAAHNLSEKVPKVSQLPKNSGLKGCGKLPITIVPSSNEQRLHSDAKQWMESIIDNAATNESALDAHNIVSVLMRVLLAFDPVAFEDAAAKESMSADSICTKCKLDAEVQQAMMHEANLTWTQLQTIKKHLCCSNIDILQPEPVTREPQAQSFVRPTPIESCEGKGNRKRVA